MKVATIKTVVVRPDQLQGAPELLAALEQAEPSDEVVISYRGRFYALTPLEDITHTSTPKELDDFRLSYKEADDPATHLTPEQALAEHRRLSRDD